MSVIEDIKPITTPTDTDENILAHYVVPKSEVTRAMVTGEPCEALCGYKWVPSRIPENYPICEECQRLAERYLGT